MIARLLDRFGYVLAEVRLPHKSQAPDALIWGPNVFARRPDRDDPIKHYAKCYVIVSSYVVTDTYPTGSQTHDEPQGPPDVTG